ncbi:MAG: endonuclease III domain-containing protein [Aggregatilineales bacterium]
MSDIRYLPTQAKSLQSSTMMNGLSAPERYQEIARRLADRYGRPTWRMALPPVDELVNTILSQNTSDTNRDRAFAQLRARFPSWEAVRDAPEDAVIDAVRPAGLANQKGPRIQAVLQRITDEQGTITLEFLRDQPLDEAKAWLTGLNGVGPKTAAIVLLFAMNRPAFPVDTHVYRVTKRLGLIPENSSVERAHELLAAIVPPDDYYEGHLNLIRHGREVCHARRPACSQCPLTDLCDYYKNPDQQASIVTERTAP